MKATKLIAIFAIIAIISTGIVVAWCYDSDGGNKPFVRGFVRYDIGGNQSLDRDKCIYWGVDVMNCSGYGCNLREGVCHNGTPGYIFYQNAINCTKGKLT